MATKKPKISGVRQRMKAKRIEAGLTERAFAARRGVHRNAVWEAENYGEAPPPEQTIHEYSDILSEFVRVSAKYLRTGRYR